ncbi:IS110 family transposase [Candidatus Saccharibacteria bacterium]|nr:IS110 family transposase [Candidatus Saccharibacteria bacterium]
MIYVGIDVAKDKHDCCILGPDGEVLRDSITFANNRKGFEELLAAIQKALQEKSRDEVRAGLESTGHYSTNLVAFLRSNGFEPVVLNPLSVNRFRKSQTLRKTKTDKADARFIAAMLLTSAASPHASVSYHIEELKVFTRSRSRLIEHRGKLRISMTRLLDVVFPELATLVWSTNQKSVYHLLLELPNPQAIAHCRIDRLTNIISAGSHGKYGREKALEIRQAAAESIGSNSPAMAFELQQTIRLIQNITIELDLLDNRIEAAVEAVKTPLLTIPGISYTLAGIILAEIGAIERFQTPAQLLAFAGMEPSTFQSGKFRANQTPMVKRGSTYLRWAVLQAARLVAMRDKTFYDYLLKKRQEGKHFNVALSHVGKKLVRVIFHMLQTNRSFVPQS